MRTFYGKVTAPASERAMLESLGIEVAPLRAEDGEAFYVATDAAGRARLAELANDFPARLYARPGVDGPLSIVTMTADERAAEAAYIDFKLAQGHPAPAWVVLQRDAVNGGRSPFPKLPDEQVRTILAAHGESADLDHISHYPSLAALASEVRASRNWGAGQIFVCALDDARFVIMKQIAPSSCEMLTLTHHGYHDVLTAYRYGQDELIEALRDYLQVGPEPQLHYESPIGFSVVGYTVGHRAKVTRDGPESTIVGIGVEWRGGETGQPWVMVEQDPAPGDDAAAGGAGRCEYLHGNRLASTWTPPSASRVLPALAPYRDDVLLKQGTTVALQDPDTGLLCTGIVCEDFTLGDRAARHSITVQPLAGQSPRVTGSEYALRRIVKPAPDTKDFVRRPAHTYRVAVLTVSPEGERVPLGVVFSRGASMADAENRAYDRVWTPELRAARLTPEYQSEPVPRYVHGCWSTLLAGSALQDLACRFVYDRQREDVTNVEVRVASSWVPATPAQADALRDTLRHANAEAVFGPANWGLSESDTLPAWIREAAPAPAPSFATLMP